MTTIATTRDAMAAAKTRMEKAVDDFRKEVGTLRTGRANAAILVAKSALSVCSVSATDGRGSAARGEDFSASGSEPPGWR